MHILLFGDKLMLYAVIKAYVVQLIPTLTKAGEQCDIRCDMSGGAASGQKNNFTHMNTPKDQNPKVFLDPMPNRQIYLLNHYSRINRKSKHPTDYRVLILAFSFGFIIRITGRVPNA